MEFCGHDFADAALLAEALTTPSCRMADAAVRDNQRLEFLGDAVLGMIAAERLYAAMPGENEGSLTVRRTRMVSTAALAAAAARAGIAAHLKVGRGAPPVAEGSKTLADAVEAVIGAAYLDGGIAAAREVFAALGLGEEQAAAEWGGNPKGRVHARFGGGEVPRAGLHLAREGRGHGRGRGVRPHPQGGGGRRRRQAPEVCGQRVRWK